AKHVKCAARSVVLGAAFLYIQQSGQRQLVHDLERARVRDGVLGVGITDDADLGIGHWQPVGTKEQRVPLVSSGSRRAQRIDVLYRASTQPGNRDLSTASAAHESGPDDDTRGVTDDIGPFGFVGAKPFEQVEDLCTTKARHLTPVSSELRAELPREVLSRIRTCVDGYLEPSVRQRSRVFERTGKSGCC